MLAYQQYPEIVTQFLKVLYIKKLTHLNRWTTTYAIFYHVTDHWLKGKREKDYI